MWRDPLGGGKNRAFYSEEAAWKKTQMFYLEWKRSGNTVVMVTQHWEVLNATELYA